MLAVGVVVVVMVMALPLALVLCMVGAAKVQPVAVGKARAGSWTLLQQQWAPIATLRRCSCCTSRGCRSSMCVGSRRGTPCRATVGAV